METVLKAPHPRKSLYSERQVFWHQAMELYEHSGQSAKVFCETHQLRHQEFKRWRVRFNKAAYERLGKKLNSSFVELKVEETENLAGETKAKPLELSLGKELKVMLSADFDEQALKKLLKVLGS